MLTSQSTTCPPTQPTTALEYNEFWTMWATEYAGLEAIETYGAFEVMSPLTSDDDAVLEAALRFLDEVNVAPTTPRSPMASVDHSPLPAQSCKKPCKRMKEKIEELRDEAEELERHVKRLRSRQCAANSVSEMWEAMISRQIVQRQRAEVENARLRKRISDHSDLVQKLQALIADHKRRASVTRTSFRGVITPLSSNGSFFSVIADSDALESVASALVPMYQQTKWVLANPMLNALTGSSDGCRVLTKSMPGIDCPTVQMLDARTVPFDLNTTTEAVWANLITRLGSVIDPHDPSAQVFHAEVDLRIQLPAFDGTLHNIMALRRFEEKDRVVIVRSSVFTYLGTEDGAELPCLAARHFLWTIVQRQPSPGVSSASQIQTLGVSIPTSTPESHVKADAVNKFLSEISEQFCEFAHEDVDNRLLQHESTAFAPLQV